MNREMLMLVDAISREKSVDRDVVFGAVEAALAQATKKLNGGEVDIRVAVDRDTGVYETFRRWLVVPDEAGLQNPDAEEMLSMRWTASPRSRWTTTSRSRWPSVPIGRIGAMAAKQVILQKIRDAEREHPAQ
jgi:N utilization substance protein A